MKAVYIEQFKEVKEMPVTITLNDNLAARLQLQALTQRVSLEQWALSILGHAAEHPRELQTWAALNQRQFALLDKKYSVGLDEAEEREFAQLQAAVAGLLEPWDRAMIEKLDPYEALAEQLSHADD